MDDPFDPNEQVEVAPGLTKRLGDCTLGEVEAAAELLKVRETRLETATADVLVGLSPKCDYLARDGSYCDHAAEWIRVEGSEKEPRALCEAHLPRDFDGVKALDRMSERITITVRLERLETEVIVEPGEDWRENVLAAIRENASLTLEDIAEASMGGRPVAIREVGQGLRAVEGT